MKKARSFKAAVALGSFTAAVALLSGMPGASAQTAPGGGSMPGSFLVPGTNTSIAFHGIIWFVGSDYVGPHQGDTGGSGTPSVVLHGNGVAGGSSPAYSVNGGMQFDLKPVRFITQTSTPTAYGELKTYFEFDFDQFSSGQLTGSNSDTARLRQGYGTLGPWLIGQAWSTYADLQSWSDGDGGDPTIDSGVPMNTVNGRVPQIRYTFLGGGGLSIAGALEMPITYYNIGTAGANLVSNSNNYASPTTSVFAAAGSGGGIQDVPAFAGTAEWDQPWGHVAGHIALQDLQVRNAAAISEGNNINKFGYAGYLSGHLNTWGKDRVGGGVDYAHGALNYGPSNATPGTGEGIIGSSPLASGAATSTCTAATSIPSGTSSQINGCDLSLVNIWGIYANYLHYWSDTLRTNVDAGYDHASRPSATDNWTLGQLSTLQNFSYSTHLNLIWSPVPGLISLTGEWDYFRRSMFGQAYGGTNQFIAQAKFFW